MSRSQTESKKIISIQTAASSFVGMLAAVPLAFALTAPMMASANETKPDSAVAEASTDDFAQFAYAYTQGMQASATSSSSAGNGAQACADTSVKGADTGNGVQTLGAYNGMGAAGNGNGYGDKSPGRHADDMVKAYKAYYSYKNTVHNSSSVTNINSNNTVGSHNTNKTEIEVEDSHGVVVGVSNENTSVQKNANQSYNDDSFNTKETNINGSFNDDVDVTKNTSVAVASETTVTNTENSNNNNGNYSNNTTNSNNELEIELEAEIDILSDNEVILTEEYDD